MWVESTSTCLWRWNRQSVPKRRHINSRRLVITQKKAYSIQNTVKAWNQEISLCLHFKPNFNLKCLYYYSWRTGGQKYHYTLFYVISIYDTILFGEKFQYEKSSNYKSSDPLFRAVRRLIFSQLQSRLTYFPYKAVRSTFQTQQTLLQLLTFFPWRPSHLA